MLKEIVRIDFKNSEITVENNLSESEKLTMTNVSKGLRPSLVVYGSKNNSSIKALVFLSCNIGDIAYYVIQETSDVKFYLIKVSDFDNEFKVEL
jgi:hypothetical protein